MTKNYASAKKADSLPLHGLIVFTAGACTFASGVCDWQIMPALWVFAASIVLLIAGYAFMTYGLSNYWRPRLCVTLNGCRRYYEGSASYYYQPAGFGLRLVFFPEPVESGHREIQEADGCEVSLSTSEYMNIYVLGYNDDTVGAVLDTATLYSWPIAEGRLRECDIGQFRYSYLQPAFDESEASARDVALRSGFTLKFREMEPA